MECISQQFFAPASISGKYLRLMEQDISILIADLSGYTALTETHGSFSAADLIDKYVEIVNEALVGTSRLQERVGDEVMIMATHADDLLATADVLLQRTTEQCNFLQVHGALHYGRLLKRNNSYFGSPLNLTSRVAAQAPGGTFLCTADFYDVVNDKRTNTFKSLGKFSFKNVAEEKEVFEIIPENRPHYYIDPVCRMIVYKGEASYAHPGQSELLFCSEGCRSMYLKNEKESE